MIDRPNYLDRRQCENCGGNGGTDMGYTICPDCLGTGLVCSALTAYIAEAQRLQAAARVRPASPDGEGRRRAVLTIIRDQPLHPDMRTDFRQDWVKDEIARKVAALSAPAPAAPPDAIASARADERERAARVADEYVLTAEQREMLTKPSIAHVMPLTDIFIMAQRTVARAIRALGPVPSADAGGGATEHMEAFARGLMVLEGRGQYADSTGDFYDGGQPKEQPAWMAKLPEAQRLHALHERVFGGTTAEGD